MAVDRKNRAFISGIEGWPDAVTRDDKWFISDMYYALDHYALALASGVLSELGAVVNLKTARKLGVASGVITENGNAIGLSATRKLAVSSGAITDNGTAVGLRSEEHTSDLQSR